MGGASSKPLNPPPKKHRNSASPQPPLSPIVGSSSGSSRDPWNPIKHNKKSISSGDMHNTSGYSAPPLPATLSPLVSSSSSRAVRKSTSVPIIPVAGPPLQAPAINFMSDTCSSASQYAKLLHRKILKLYNEYISEEGHKVNYKAISKSPDFTDYVALTTDLRHVDLGSLTEDESKAFFINLYNALVIHGHIVNGVPGGPIFRSMFFRNCRYNIGGEEFSLNDMEHGVLRGNRKHPSGYSKQFHNKDQRMRYVVPYFDARIHFALVCGAKSCPALRIYDAENLERGLALASQHFCEHNVEIDRDAKKIVLSMIFRWYHVDFGDTDDEMLYWILPHLSPDKRLLLESILNSKDKYTVSYRPYNWEINA
eukprot:TRINITY_DN3549_c0_g1_i1.p1 TRINITY_DN3549_c0_g1~~TRINITY_DN3549_c0_g1_i1.p1  ORF type:complete len:367 (-),score=58.20 TRINITY_DN3549_c0_g1_i1:151-1251(-)